jgi:glucose dehydrogenase
MRSIWVGLLAGSLLSGLSQSVPQDGDWPIYGRDPGGSRFSPLDQINTSNVSQLKRAWTYHTGEEGRSFETTPIVVDNVLYLSTQNQNIVALDPETGKQIWKYNNPSPNGREQRGVSFWPGNAETPARLVFGTGDGRRVELENRDTGAWIWRQRCR